MNQHRSLDGQKQMNPPGLGPKIETRVSNTRGSMALCRAWQCHAAQSWTHQVRQERCDRSDRPVRNVRTGETKRGTDQKTLLNS